MAFPKRPDTTLYVMTLDVADLSLDERHCYIRRLFESSLGSYVSEATLMQGRIHIVLHVKPGSMKAVCHALSEVLPEAVLRGVHPREFDHFPKQRLS
jgi:hypothetical protein